MTDTTHSPSGNRQKARLRAPIVFPSTIRS